MNTNEEAKEEDKVWVNKLQNVQSSSAGSGSNFFKIFLLNKDKESDRLKAMQERDMLIAEELNEKRESVKAKDWIDAKAAKKREKRKKRKDIKKGNAITQTVKELIVQQELADRCQAQKVATTGVDVDSVEEPAKRVRTGRHPGIRIIVQDDEL
jgi:hypothetical protein